MARRAMLAMSSGLRWMKGILMAARGGCTPTVSGQPQQKDSGGQDGDNGRTTHVSR